jgi:hypothetical protein
VQYQRSFNEMLALDPRRAAKTLYFPWFDQASPGVLVDNLHVVNPGPDAAAGNLSGPGWRRRRFRWRSASSATSAGQPPRARSVLM